MNANQIIFNCIAIVFLILSLICFSFKITELAVIALLIAVMSKLGAAFASPRKN